MIKRIKADLIIDTDELRKQLSALREISYSDYIHTGGYVTEVRGMLLLLEEIQDQCNETK